MKTLATYQQEARRLLWEVSKEIETYDLGARMSLLTTFTDDLISRTFSEIHDELVDALAGSPAPEQDAEEMLQRLARIRGDEKPNQSMNKKKCRHLSIMTLSGLMGCTDCGAGDSVIRKDFKIPN